MQPPVQGSDLPVPGGPVDGFGNSNGPWEGEDVGILVMVMLPPREDGDSAVERSDDVQVLLEHRLEDRTVLRKEVLKHVDVTKTYNQHRTDSCGAVCAWIRRTDEREVTRKNRMVDGLCPCPLQRLWDRSRDTNCLRKLPISYLVHYLCNELNRKIGSQGLAWSTWCHAQRR